MKKTFNKMKTRLATLGVVIVSFFSKVFGQSLIGERMGDEIQAMYAAPYTPTIEILEQPTFIDIATKIAKWPLIGITFIVGIISFIKIRKIEDKAQKKKKIKGAVIGISILVVLIIACFVLPLLLKKY